MHKNIKLDIVTYANHIKNLNNIQCFMGMDGKKQNTASKNMLLLTEFNILYIIIHI